MSNLSQEKEQNPNWRGGKATLECAECHKTFEAHRADVRRGRKFCSTECGYENKRNQVIFECEYCGKKAQRRKSDYEKAKIHFCSKECDVKWRSENLRGERSFHYGKKQTPEQVEKRIKTGENHHGWKGGRTIHAGYVYMTTDDGRRVLEHRLKAEKALGRKMNPWEVVHHINGDRTDNRNCNLLICDKSYHQWLEREMARLYKQEHFAHI